LETGTCLERLRQFVEGRDYAGYKPYAALNSPFLRLLSLGTKWGRMAWTQFFRRCPLNLRPLLGITKQVNAKALGLFATKERKGEKKAVGLAFPACAGTADRHRQPVLADGQHGARWNERPTSMSMCTLSEVCTWRPERLDCQ